MSHEYDIIVFGATGDTGRCVCHFLFNEGSRVGIESWAPAARNLKKLNKLLGEVVATSGEPGSDHGVLASPAIQADSNDYESMLEMAKKAKVVVACAGPFAKFGENCVRACVEAGTNYVDITGETFWVNKMAKKYGEEARAKGISIISQAAYDSVPSDITVALAAKAIEAKGEKIGKAETHHVLKGGALPVGTANTILEGVMGARGKLISSLTFGVMGKKSSKKSKSSYSSNPGLVPKAADKAAGKDVSGNMLNFYDGVSGIFSFPHFMANVNTPIVHSTAIALNYGVDTNKNFSYRERLGSDKKDISSLYGFLPVAGVVSVASLGALIAGLPLLFVYLCAPGLIVNYVKSMAEHGGDGSKDKTFKLLFKNNGFNENGLTYVIARASSSSGKTNVRTTFKSKYDAGLGFTALSAVTVAAALLKPDEIDNYGGGFQTAVAAIGPESLREWYGKVNVDIQVHTESKL